MNQFLECFKVLYLGFSYSLLFFKILSKTNFYSKINKYVNTLVFFARSDVHNTERVLRMEMDVMEQYYREHKLIINLKKGKMESVLFRISERSSSQERDQTFVRLGRLESAEAASLRYSKL